MAADRTRRSHLRLVAAALVLALAASMAALLTSSTPAGAASPTTSTISGTVNLYPNRTRASGINVWLYTSTNQLRAATTTAADGAFAFTGLANGSYTVQVWDPSGVLAGSWWRPAPCRRWRRRG